MIALAPSGGSNIVERMDSPPSGRLVPPRPVPRSHLYEQELLTQMMAAIDDLIRDQP
jgi:hypothetical protein